MHDFRVHSLFNVHTQKCCSAVSHSIGIGTAGGGARAPNVFAKIYITKPIILFFFFACQDQDFWSDLSICFRRHCTGCNTHYYKVKTRKSIISDQLTYLPDVLLPASIWIVVNKIQLFITGRTKRQIYKVIQEDTSVILHYVQLSKEVITSSNIFVCSSDLERSRLWVCPAYN